MSYYNYFFPVTENDGHTNNGSTNPGNTNNRNTSNQSARPESAEECYPLRIGRMAPHEAVMVHKSVFVSPLSQPVFFDRRNEGTILRELFRKLKRRELNIMKTPDITFINEDGIDAEGLSKEFFAMVSAALSGGCGGYTLFEGSPDHLLPVISEEFHQSDYFVYVGKLIGLCVLHGGAGVVGLSRALAVYMVTAEIEMASSYMSIEDVPDYSIREKILQVRQSISVYFNNIMSRAFNFCIFNSIFFQVKLLIAAFHRIATIVVFTVYLFLTW